MSSLTRAVRQGLTCQRGVIQWKGAQGWQAFSAAPAPTENTEGDIVFDTFVEQQKAFRAVMEGMKKIQIPLNLEPAAVKKYASEVEALKRKAGIPEMEDIFSAELNQKLLMSRGSMRKFLQAATTGVDLGSRTEVVTQLFAALDKVESAHGAVTNTNEAALKAWEKESNDVLTRHKIGDVKAVKQQAIVDMYAEQLREARTSTEEQLQVIKRRDGLENLDIDVAAIKPRFA